MKSEISRKQPPIAAYAEEPIKVYPEIGVGPGRGGSIGREKDVPGRVSGEMISAIRRQRGTSGVEYWKTASSTLPLPRYTKRASFQNLFFPSLDMSGLSSENTGRIAKVRSNGTDSNPGVPLLVRSQTASDMNLSGSASRARERYQPVETKKVVVTDLTCLELGDSIDTSKSPKLAYFYQLYQAKFRYTDYFEQGVERNEGQMPLKPITGNGQTSDRVQQFHPRKPMRLNPGMRTVSLPSMHPQRRVGHDHMRVPFHGNTLTLRGPPSRRHDSNGFYVDVYSRKPPIKQIVSETILSDGHRADARDLAIKGTVYSINNSTSRNQRHIAADQVPQLHQRRTVRSASIPRVHFRKRDPSIERGRKRSVHFSGSNEVYEYAPTDPVTT